MALRLAQAEQHRAVALLGVVGDEQHVAAGEALATGDPLVADLVADGVVDPRAALLDELQAWHPPLLRLHEAVGEDRQQAVGHVALEARQLQLRDDHGDLEPAAAALQAQQLAGARVGDVHRAAGG